MVRVWVQHHTVFWKVPQKHIDTLTNMGLSALRLRPKHYSVHLHSSSHGSQSLTLKGRSQTIYWSTVICWRLSHSNLPEIPNSIHLTLALSLSTLLIGWACPGDNSLLTPWYQMASVIPTDKRTSEKDFEAFSWSWQLKMFEKHCLRNHSLGNSESVKVFNVFTQTILSSPTSPIHSHTQNKRTNKPQKPQPYFCPLCRTYSSNGNTNRCTSTSARYGFLGVKYHLLSLP